MGVIFRRVLFVICAILIVGGLASFFYYQDNKFDKRLTEIEQIKNKTDHISCPIVETIKTISGIGYKPTRYYMCWNSDNCNYGCNLESVEFKGEFKDVTTLCDDGQDHSYYSSTNTQTFRFCQTDKRVSCMVKIRSEVCSIQ